MTEIDIKAEKAAYAMKCYECDEPTEGLNQVEDTETYVIDDATKETEERKVTRGFCSNDCAVKWALKKKK